MGRRGTAEYESTQEREARRESLAEALELVAKAIREPGIYRAPEGIDLSTLERMVPEEEMHRVMPAGHEGAVALKTSVIIIGEPREWGKETEEWLRQVREKGVGGVRGGG